MECKIDGCCKDVMYKSKQICQMHYFRFMRNGSYEIKPIENREGYIRNRKYRTQNPAGYQKLYEPEHPLADKGGDVYEHRFVYYNEVSKEISACDKCRNPITWKDCHIDHIDADVTNNNKDNLRPLCRGCNVFRGHTPTSMGKHMFTIGEKTLPANTWARMDDVQVSGATIVRRRSMGMSDYDAIYSPRITHHNTKTKKYSRKYDKERGI